MAAAAAVVLRVLLDGSTAMKNKGSADGSPSAVVAIICLLNPAGGLTSSTSSTPSSRPTPTLQAAAGKPRAKHVITSILLADQQNMLIVLLLACAHTGVHAADVVNNIGMQQPRLPTYLKNMLIASGIHSTNVRAVSTGASLVNVKHGVKTK
jgi:hypothetical protein